MADGTSLDGSNVRCFAEDHQGRLWVGTENAGLLFVEAGSALLKNYMPGVKHNYSYFPIFVNAEKYGMTRDELYFKMKERNILGRRYFYPLISEFDTYKGLPSAGRENLPNAHMVADSVICLPMHHELSGEDLDRILDVII